MRRFSRRVGLRTIASRGTSIGYCFSGIKLHERDRLKHVGGLGEEQTAKVVRNGEGGTKRVWKPATRNRVFRESSPRPPPSGSGRYAGNPLHTIGRCELRFEPDGEAEQLDGLGTLTSCPVRRVVGAPTESGLVSAGSWEVRRRNRSNRRLGGWTVHFSVSLASAVIFGLSRGANVSLTRRAGCGLRTTFGESSWAAGRPNAFGRQGTLPTFVTGDGFGQNRRRVQRGWNDHSGWR